MKVWPQTVWRDRCSLEREGIGEGNNWFVEIPRWKWLLYRLGRWAGKQAVRFARRCDALRD